MNARQVLTGECYRMALLALCLSILLLTQGCSFFDKEVVFGGLSGSVIDKKTGQPIEGAVVFVHWQSERVGFEVAGSRSVYVKEALTDKNGYFLFDDSDPTTVKFSLRLREYAPTIGFIKEGYEPYLTSSSHNAPSILNNKYTPRKSELLNIEMAPASIDRIISGVSLTLPFVMELEAIIRHHRCDPDRLPKTIAKLKIILSDAKKHDKRFLALYSSIERIVDDATCNNIILMKEREVSH